jgi:hypothetical protein
MVQQLENPMLIWLVQLQFRNKQEINVEYYIGREDFNGTTMEFIFLMVCILTEVGL